MTQPKVKVAAFLTALLCAVSVSCLAQDAVSVRREIEAAEASVERATTSKDAAALKKLLSPDVIINSPANRVINREQMIEVTLSGEMTYSEFKNEIEAFSMYGPDLAVMMGQEVFVHADHTFGDKKVVRRYTDVWQRNAAGWVLIARQATLTPAS